MTEPRQQPLLAWLPLALLIIVIVGLFHRLLTGDVLFWGLPSLQFYPWREFAMSELAQGRLPLWNPYNGAGAPLLANYQSALLYPPHLLYFLFSGPQMMGWLGMLHILWAGLGMWLLTRRLGVPIIGQGIATLAYPLSNTIIARFGTFPMVDAAAWLPWLILATDMLLVKRDYKLSLWLRFAALVGVMAMLLLAGHAQWGFYSLLLAGAYAVWVMIFSGEDRAGHDRPLQAQDKDGGSTPAINGRAESRDSNLARRFIAGMVIFLLALALAIGIAAVQLIPTAELQHESQRASGVTEDFAFNFSYPPASLITLLNPNFLGNPGDGSYVVPALYYEIAAYIGFMPLIIAIIGTVHYFRTARRKKQSIFTAQPLIPFFAIVTVISLVFAFGKFTPIYPFLYRYIPTFNLFQAPARWLLLTIFSLTMLAALATIDWQPERRSKRRARLAVAGSIGLIILGLVALMITSSMARPILSQLLRGFVGIGILALMMAFLLATHRPDRRWTLAVLIFVALDLWWANALSNPTVPVSFYDKQPASTSTRLFLPDPKNEAVPQWAYDQFLTFKDYQTAVTKQADYRRANLPDLNLLDRQPELNSFDPLRPDGLDRYTQLLNTTSSYALFQNAAVGKVYGSEKSSTTPPRVWLASEVQYASSLDDAQRAMPALAAGAALVTDQTAMLDHLGTGTAEIKQETPLDLIISVKADQDALLVVADTYYPGWQATIDGAPVSIYRANLAFRAVKIPAGQHTVEMSYQPKSLIVGAVISLISLVGLAIIALIGIWQAKSQR